MTHVNRRAVLWLAAVATLVLNTGLHAADEKDFTIVLLPDTQNYSQPRKPGLEKIYVQQAEWIKSRAKADNIKFVIHLGDIVQNVRPGREHEWKNADRAHKVLDGAVPYSMLPGNHDLDQTLTEEKKWVLTRGTKGYNKYFPPSRFEKYAWYGGHMGETNDNNYCHFEACGMKFLVLSLEFAPRDEAIRWAEKICQAHKDHRVIVATHLYMNGEGRIGKPDKPTNPYNLGGNDGERLWQKFVSKQRNIFMVVCGHIMNPPAYHQISKNAFGKPVREILCDYQGQDNGGNGWLQTMRFVPSENKIYVKAYSPTLKQTRTEPPHGYTLEYDMSGACVAKKAE